MSNATDERVLPELIIARYRTELERLTGRKTPYRDKTQPTHLRNFFHYLFKEGLTAANLALCIPKVAQRHGARLPRHLAPAQVESVLAAVRSAEITVPLRERHVIQGLRRKVAVLV